MNQHVLDAHDQLDDAEGFAELMYLAAQALDEPEQNSLSLGLEAMKQRITSAKELLEGSEI